MWIVINVLTNEIVARDLADEIDALKYMVAHKSDALTHQYKGTRKKVKR